LLIAGDVHPAGGIGDCHTLLFHSTDDGRSWSVRSGLTGVDENKGDEVALLETRPGELLCLLRDRQRKDIYRYWSRDGGRTWSERASIRDMLDCTLQRPFLTRVSDDVILLSGRDFGRKEVVAFVSRDGGRTFAERRTIDSYQGDGGYTAAVRLDDSSVRIVWYADRRATLNMPDVKAARLTIPARSVDASPLFSFGLVADVQYADKPDRPPRLYRDSLERLRECVTELNRHPLDFTIQLGDLIDGNIGPEKTREDLDRVMSEFARLDKRLYHVAGNHCLNAGREEIEEKLGLDRAYYDFTPDGVEGWRLIVLDGNDAGYGVLGEEQTAWLKQTLDAARRRNERVILFNHFAVLKKAAARHRMKTPEPLQSIITRSGCVVAYFAGHDHAGGYAEEGGIQHVTFHGMVESGWRNAYAIVYVFQDRIEIRGFGAVPSRRLALLAPALPKTAERGARAADRDRVTAPAAGSGKH
ncbi:MAG: hypothetical protein GX621_01855, partial [Pirellulaceae bacterium]|nr:hypothetical protein [Pirellulaceae bacterium]